MSLSGFASSEFDFLTPGAQVPLTGTDGQTAATQALASAAYRDQEMTALSAIDDGRPDADRPTATKTAVKDPKISLFRANLGEAWGRAVQVRMLGGGRKQVVQSFGSEPQTVVEHCLAANRIRQERDARLTAVTAGFGLLFLPGLLVWLGAFQLRDSLAKMQTNRRVGALGQVVLLVAGFLAVLLAIHPPLSGFWSFYLRIVMLVPVLGWFWAKRICETYARDLNGRWKDLCTGSAVGAKIPEAVPRNPNQTKAESLRQNFAKLSTVNDIFLALQLTGAVCQGTSATSRRPLSDIIR